jgi:ABC-type antimicrobial peptide transport system permease subunit
LWSPFWWAGSASPTSCWLGFSATVGVAAGFLPALKASRLDVIEALRCE